MKKFTVEKLNKRYNGSKWFQYRLKIEPLGNHYEIYPERASNFLLIRNWCWETWGPSSELEMYGVASDKSLRSDHWAWRYINYGSRAGALESFIYIAGEKELSLLTLKFG